MVILIKLPNFVACVEIIDFNERFIRKNIQRQGTVRKMG